MCVSPVLSATPGKSKRTEAMSRSASARAVRVQIRFLWLLGAPPAASSATSATGSCSGVVITAARCSVSPYGTHIGYSRHTVITSRTRRHGRVAPGHGRLEHARGERGEDVDLVADPFEPPRRAAEAQGILVDDGLERARAPGSPDAIGQALQIRSWFRRPREL